jgi:hypothetical protein
VRVKKSLLWPKLPNIDLRNLSGTLSNLERFFQQLRKALDNRDQELALAINSGDIEIVSSEPSGAPDYEAPTLQFYKSGATWRLYVYTGAADGWVYVNADG